MMAVDNSIQFSMPDDQQPSLLNPQAAA